MAAYEIPTAVIMRFIEGNPLQDVAQWANFDRWIDGLNILSRVGRHLHYSHNLPQGVLHRDVRPSNIMLPNFVAANHNNSAGKWDVVVLNYDMSWHTAARGGEIKGNVTEVGYYAPEHLSGDRQKARSTLIDSFGLGMTAFYVFSGFAPPPAGSGATDWDNLLRQAFRPDHRLKWRSAPERLRRMVRAATDPEQSRRPEVIRLAAEFELLLHALEGKRDKIPAEMWAEELMSRAEEAEYSWVPGRSEFVREPRVGRKIRFTGLDREKNVTVDFENVAVESTDQASASRTWPNKLRESKAILERGGWEISKDSQNNTRNILLKATITIDKLLEDQESVIEHLRLGLLKVRLD